MEALTLLQFVVALFMSLGALCLFVWGVLSGAFEDVEGIAWRAAELDHEEHDDGRAA